MLLNTFLFFLNTYGYLKISTDIKIICGYLTDTRMDMRTGTRQIFIQRIRYVETTTHTLPNR